MAAPVTRPLEGPAPAHIPGGAARAALSRPEPLALTGRAARMRIRGRRLVVAGIATFVGIGVVGSTFFGLPIVAVGLLIAVVLIIGALTIPVERLLPITMLIAFTLDVPAENPYVGLWRPPWTPLSELLFDNIRKSVPGTFIPLSPYVMLLALMTIRALTAPKVQRDRVGRAMRSAIGLSLIAIAAVEVYGIARGGNIETSLRQITGLVTVPMVALLVVEGTRSHHAMVERLAKAVLLAASIKAVIAIYAYVAHIRPMLGVVRIDADGLPIPPPEYVTTHSDSVLWAWALMLLVLRWLDGRWPRRRTQLMLLGPLLAAAIVVNARRLTWVQLAMCAIVVVWFSRPLVKRQISRIISVTWPIALLYVAAGWTSNASVFSPVQSLRSVFSTSDASNASRDIENLNLVFTFRQRPLLGTGFGHPYDVLVAPIDLSKGFQEFRYVPHNSLLALYAFAGPIGFIGFWSVIVVGMTYAIRAYRDAAPSAQWARSVALWSVSGLIIYMLQAWGDIGMQAPYVAFVAGASCGCAVAAARMAGSEPERAASSRSGPGDEPGGDLVAGAVDGRGEPHDEQVRVVAHRFDQLASRRQAGRSQSSRESTSGASSGRWCRMPRQRNTACTPCSETRTPRVESGRTIDSVGPVPSMDQNGADGPWNPRIGPVRGCSRGRM